MKSDTLLNGLLRHETATQTGYGLCRSDGNFVYVSSILEAMVHPWGGITHWWALVRQNGVPPAPTRCPQCNLGQTLGSLEVELPGPTETCFFEISFTGHSHGLTDSQAGDMLLIRNITSQKRQIKSLKETLQQFESLCESIQDVYYRTDMSGRILFISPSCRKLISYRPEELVGRSLVDLCIDPGYWAELLDILDQTDTVNDFDLVLQCQKGNQVPVSMNARLVISDSGEKILIEGILRDVTEREHLDGILAERTRKLQNTMVELEHQKFALDQHAIVTIADSEGRIIYANRKMIEISQYALSDLMGQTHKILDSGLHAKSFFKEMWRQITNGRVWHGEIRNRKKDGSFYWIDCTIVPFMTPAGKPYQYVAISTDISERINAERRLERSRSFLLSITDAMAEGVYVLDLQGCVIFLNKEAERLLGYREEDLLGKNLHEIIHFRKLDGTPYPAEDCPVHRSLLGRSFRMDDDHFIRKDGTLFPVSYVTAPMLEEGEITGSVAVFQDITQRQRFEQDLKHARDMALEASRLKSEFLANMSHEIRTPMNAIIGMNDLLMDTPLNVEQQEFAEIVADSASSLLSLINDILDFSKIEAGKIDLEEIDFAPVTVVEGSAELLISQAQSKSISLSTFISPRIPKILKGDPGRLRQMLINLISNAVKFTDDGEVAIRVLLESETASHVTLYFSVTDTGIGLSKKAHERLFKPFSQADGATTRKYGGTGLGLAISKRLAELMGGQIGAISREGEGSTFWFRAPLRRSESSQPPESERIHTEAIQGMRILGVVGFESDREFLEGYLTSWGATCHCPTSLEEACIRVTEWFPDARGVDVVLIGENHLDADTPTIPKPLLQHPALTTSKFIVLQDGDDKDMRDSACEQGFATCLHKPVRQSELVETLVLLIKPDLLENREEVFASSGQTRESPTVPDPDVYDALESGKLLLLAEDNPVNQKVALMQLKKLGYAVHAVANGKEAVEAVTHLPYALILMDCQMPVMDGFEATHAIRRLETTTSRHIPIIAMTANAMKGDRERCLKAGMDDYLSKPVSPEELKKRLEFWIPKSAGELPPIDINQLHQLFGNDEEVIRELLGHFLPTARDLLDRLKVTMDLRQPRQLAEISNELRGACANMGASSMAQLARRLERLAQDPNWEEVNVTLTAMNRAFDKVDLYVQNY